LAGERACTPELVSTETFRADMRYGTQAWQSQEFPHLVRDKASSSRYCGTPRNDNSFDAFQLKWIFSHFYYGICDFPSQGDRIHRRKTCQFLESG
jgi:hypothetical protein